MSKPKKQHFIPKVYLKYFSASEDGLGIYVLDHFHPYKKTIQKVNSGDHVFWEKGFYATGYFEDVYHLERFFSEEIESGYNNLIKRIKQERPIEEWDIKLKLFEWIFYGKFRSPVFRDYFEDKLTKAGHHNPIEIKNLSRMAHLELFQNEALYNKVLAEILTHFQAKRWNLIKTSDDMAFFTTDSPGFNIRLDHLEKNNNVVPSPFWHDTTVDNFIFFPLTKNYAIEIVAYETGSMPELNLQNTPILFKSADEHYVTLMNYWTICTGKMVISSDEKALKIVEQVKNSRDDAWL